MLQLLDGPCEGVYYVKRAPLFLRAVIDKSSGEKDVLDLIEDTPRNSESIHIYERKGSSGWVHIHGKKIHGFYALGDYRFLPEIVGENFRDNLAWQKWATEQLEKQELEKVR